MKIVFFEKERLYLNNKYFQPKSSPTFTGKRSKNNKHQKLIMFNPYNLFVWKIPSCCWRSQIRTDATTLFPLVLYHWAILQCSTDYLHRWPVPFIFAHTKFLESKLIKELLIKYNLLQTKSAREAVSSRRHTRLCAPSNAPACVPSIPDWAHL